MTAGFDTLPATFSALAGQGLPGPGRDMPGQVRRRTSTQDWMLFQPRLALQGGRLQAVESATRMPPAQAGRTAGGAGQDMAQGGRTARLAAWRLETAAAEIGTWGGARLRLCVAVPAELHPETLLSLLDGMSVEPGGAACCEHLELACTEGWLWSLDGDGVMALAAISDLGVEMAVEDFGESSASLALLRRLPLGVVRLHASLVRDLERGAEDRAVLRAIVGTAHAIGLRVAASGVDTQRQAEVLHGLGCDEGVGHALGTPVPSRQLARLLGAARQAGETGRRRRAGLAAT